MEHNEETKQNDPKDITDQYTGGDEVGEDELDYEEEDQPGGMDATALGIDSDQIGQLMAWGMSYVVCRPREIDVNGEHYDLQGNYINSVRGEYAELAKGLNLEEHLANLEIAQMTPGQAVGVFALLSTGLVFKQRKEFQKELEKIKSNGQGNKEEENNEHDTS